MKPQPLNTFAEPNPSVSPQQTTISDLRIFRIKEQNETHTHIHTIIFDLRVLLPYQGPITDRPTNQPTQQSSQTAQTLNCLALPTPGMLSTHKFCLFSLQPLLQLAQKANQPLQRRCKRVGQSLSTVFSLSTLMVALLFRYRLLQDVPFGGWNQAPFAKGEARARTHTNKLLTCHQHPSSPLKQVKTNRRGQHLARINPTVMAQTCQWLNVKRSSQASIAESEAFHLAQPERGSRQVGWVGREGLDNWHEGCGP